MARTIRFIDGIRGRGPLLYLVSLDRTFDREAAVELGFSISQLPDGTECAYFATDAQAVAGQQAISKLAAAKRKADRMRQHV